MWKQSKLVSLVHDKTGDRVWYLLKKKKKVWILPKESAKWLMHFLMLLFYNVFQSHTFPILFQNVFNYLFFSKSVVLILKTANLHAFFSELPVCSHGDGQQGCFMYSSCQCNGLSSKWMPA